jgi:hypothetical protein
MIESISAEWMYGTHMIAIGIGLIVVLVIVVVIVAVRGD